MHTCVLADKFNLLKIALGLSLAAFLRRLLAPTMSNPPPIPKHCAQTKDSRIRTLSRQLSDTGITQNAIQIVATT